MLSDSAVLEHVVPEASIWVPEGMILLSFPQDNTSGGVLVRVILVWLPQEGELADLARKLFALRVLTFNGEDCELDLTEGSLFESLSPRMRELLTLLEIDEKVHEAFGRAILDMRDRN